MLARLVRDGDTCRVSKLIARPYNEVLKGILRNEIVIRSLYSLALFSLRALFGVRLPIGLFIDFKNNFDLLLCEHAQVIFDLCQIMFSQPVAKKLVGHTQTNFIFIS